MFENHSPGEKNTGYSFYFTADQSIGGLTMRDRHDIRQEAKVSGSICIYKFKLKQQNWENLAFLFLAKLQEKIVTDGLVTTH